ncbi:MAG TPA: L-rhamnose mutarotase [Anaerohalosphaeraceae bacterium]|nr:L-rhamnose mutarotase [Anaerohalosphaeraceae bacterium]
MRHFRWIVPTAIAVLGFADAFAFSPYENYLLSGKPTYAGLLARAKAGREVQLAEELLKVCTDKENVRMLRAGISNPAAFRRQIQGETWFLVVFQYAGGKPYLTAAEAFESITPELKELIEPHPRAVRYGRCWLQAEWINYIRGLNVEGAPSQVLSMVTTIRPEKESEYRSLHQTVWPGVVDQMIRGNNRNFCIFLAEIGDTLYEFFYLEYMGSDFEKDDRMNQQDPVNQRWWAQTGPCQKPLPGEKEIWSPMFPVAESAAQKESKNG